MSKLNITQRMVGNIVILALSGKVLIGESGAKLRTHLRGLTQQGEKHILLDLADTSQIDSCGLGEIVAGFVSVQKGGGALKLLHLTERVNELMVITKLLTVFEVFENEEIAVKSFQYVSEIDDLKKSAFVTAKLDKAELNQ